MVKAALTGEIAVMKREWSGIKQEPIVAINALSAGTIENDRQAQARLQGCRVFGEFSRAVVERRLEQAVEEFRKWGREGQRRPDFADAGLCGLPEG